MSIEGSRFIDPFIKAKLQEHGILTEDDLCRILSSVNSSSEWIEKYDLTNQEVKPKCYVKSLQQRIPTLTAKEASVLLSLDWKRGNNVTGSYSRPLSTSSDSTATKICPMTANLGASSTTQEACNDKLLQGLPFQICTLAQLQKEKCERQKRGDEIAASTFCRSLDQLLGGEGVSLGEVLEISGSPGVGKTQLLMQLAVSCTLPVVMGGLGGSCLYVDTEGSFVPERFYQIVAAAVALVSSASTRESLSSDNIPKSAEFTSSSCNSDHLNDKNRKRERPRSFNPCQQHYLNTLSPTSSMSYYTVEYVLKRVHYCRVVNATMLLAILHCLPDIISPPRTREEVEKNGRSLSNGDGVKMVVVDSVAMPFRSLESFIEMKEDENNSTGNGWYDSLLARSVEHQRRDAASRRARLIFMVSQLLYAHATELNLAVVVSNHMVSRPLKGWLALEQWPRKYSSNYRSHMRDKELSETVLLPALGDSWGYGLSRRIVLSFHHHYLPFEEASQSTAAGYLDAFPCEKVYQDEATSVTVRKDTKKERSASSSDFSAFSFTHPQHRVARIVKGTPENCREVCFAITRKGIRDWRS